jgi:hypothetical protein
MLTIDGNIMKLKKEHCAQLLLDRLLIFLSCFSQTYIRETPNGRPGSRQSPKLHIKRTQKIDTVLDI